MKRILPNGERETIVPSIDRFINTRIINTRKLEDLKPLEEIEAEFRKGELGEERKRKEKRKAELRKSLDLKAHIIGGTRTYKRSLDLSGLCDFTQLGTYKVLLMYHSDSKIAYRDKNEWSGSLFGSVFTIKIDE
jgi:hypothetical protein